MGGFFGDPVVGAIVAIAASVLGVVGFGALWAWALSPRRNRRREVSPAIAEKWEWATGTDPRTRISDSASEHYAEAWAELTRLGVPNICTDRAAFAPMTLTDRIRWLGTHGIAEEVAGGCEAVAHDGDVIQARASRALPPIQGERLTSLSMRGLACPACSKRMNVVARAHGEHASMVFRVACPACQRGVWIKAESMRTEKRGWDAKDKAAPVEVKTEASEGEGPGDAAA